MVDNQTQTNNEEEPILQPIEEIDNSFMEESPFEQKLSMITNDVGLNRFRSSRRDGASTIAFNFDTTSTLSTSGAKLFSFKNNSVEKAYIDKDGNFVGDITGDITGDLTGDFTSTNGSVTNLTIGSLSGVLKATNGLVSGSATLNDVGVPTSNFSMNSHKLTSVTDPTSDQDAATKKYVDDNETPIPSAADAVLVSSADTERSTSNETYTKLKEIEIGKTGTYRVKWDMKVSMGARAGLSRVYVNGAAEGDEKTTYSTSYNNYSDSSISISAGDLLQLYAKEGPNLEQGGDITYIQNFRIYATEFDICNVNTD